MGYIKLAGPSDTFSPKRVWVYVVQTPRKGMGASLACTLYPAPIRVLIKVLRSTAVQTTATASCCMGALSYPPFRGHAIFFAYLMEHHHHHQLGVSQSGSHTPRTKVNTTAVELLLFLFFSVFFCCVSPRLTSSTRVCSQQYCC